MVWFKVDDNMPDHQKVRSIPRGQRCAAVGLWTLAGAWCSRHLKDGKLPGHMIEELAGKASLARLLVDAGLWHSHGHGCEKCQPVPDGFYLFHDWRGSNPTKEKVEAKREADRERLRKWREKQASNDVSNDVGNTAPDPTRPDPTRSTSDEGLGEERQVTLRAVPATTPPKCSTHPDGNFDGPCVGCKRVREYGDRLEADAKRSAAAAAANCPDCHGTNWREDEQGNPTRKCNHRRSA